MATFGTNLRKIRKAKKLSQYRLAKISGVASNHIGAIEAGRIAQPRLDVASALARALEVPLEKLAGVA